jgi:hypothetical protein
LLGGLFAALAVYLAYGVPDPIGEPVHISTLKLRATICAAATFAIIAGALSLWEFASLRLKSPPPLMTTANDEDSRLS